MALTRRAVLVGSLGSVAALATGCGSDGPDAGTSASGSFSSRYRHGRSTGWTILYPPGHDRATLPVLLALHGRSGHHTDAYRSLHLDRYLADAVAAGSRAFAIASVDGGDHEYWHPRADSDPAGMIVHEFVPLLRDRGLSVGRIAVMGWSMGGYGALYLGTRLGRSRIAAVVAESPAIWHDSYQSVAGAFDNAEDFDAHSIFGRLDGLHGVATRIDCGDRDGFAQVTRDLRAQIHPTPDGGIEPGGHNSAYWRTQAPAQLRFVGRHLGSV